MAPAAAAPYRILLMVTGGIAAYKACFLARLLTQAGFSVKVAMTDAACRFVTPMTLQVLSENPVATDLWGQGQSRAMDHIEYARWADLTVVAPATANILAKAAVGIADDIVSTLLLAFPGPVLMAPAMNDAMWRHPATQANLKTLAERGVSFVGPADGALACGTTDTGRMAEPEEILAAVRAALVRIPVASAQGVRDGFWAGKRVIVTAGPTHEPIDPVRYIANRSSGVMGYALAAAAADQGAQVTLISGPVDLLPPRGLAGFQAVVTAKDMAQAVESALTAGADWLVMAAAVADFAPVECAPGKLKKEDLGTGWSLEMTRNPDILGEIVPALRGSGRKVDLKVDLKVVGFALETGDLEARAKAKLKAKNLDYIVANDPTLPGSGFGPGLHQVLLLGPRDLAWRSESRPKAALAAQLLQVLAAAETGTPLS